MSAGEMPRSPWQPGASDRARLLDEGLAHAARYGWRVDATSGTRATVSRPSFYLPTGWHLALTLATFGLWAIVWAWARSPKRRRTTRYVSVDEAGRLRGIRVPNT